MFEYQAEILANVTPEQIGNLMGIARGSPVEGNKKVGQLLATFLPEKRGGRRRTRRNRRRRKTLKFKPAQ